MNEKKKRRITTTTATIFIRNAPAHTQTHTNQTVKKKRNSHGCESSQKHIPIQCHKMKTFLRVSCLQLAIGIAMAIGIASKHANERMSNTFHAIAFNTFEFTDCFIFNNDSLTFIEIANDI